MSIYTRILVATDFSDINRLAVERAAHLAKQDGCELILLHVVEHFPMDGGPLSSVFQYNTEPVEALTRHLQTRMEEPKQSIEYRDVQVEFRITSKSARHEIPHSIVIQCRAWLSPAPVSRVSHAHSHILRG